MNREMINMYKNFKNKNNKYHIAITVVVLFLLLTASLLIKRDNNTFIKDGVIVIEKVIMYPFPVINKEKNNTQSESYIIKKNVTASLEKEIKELKDVLELNKTLTEYEPINTTILSRNKSYWFNTVTIDKGRKDGIRANMAVVTKNGLVGKISSVSNYSSEVKLITSDDLNFKVSITIKTNDEDNYAILNGYNKKSGLITASGIDKTTNINEGDRVLTSGLGKMFPAGVYIGEVKDIKSDKYNLSKKIYIKTKQDFNDMHYLTVLKVKE